MDIETDFSEIPKYSGDISIFWFRRDLRIEDNTAFTEALRSKQTILPIFIFDSCILNELPENDARVSFIHKTILQLKKSLMDSGSDILCIKGDPLVIWPKLMEHYTIKSVFTNKDYEPYAIDRDRKIKELLKENNIAFHGYKDQVIFEENDILKGNKEPYTVFTPYKNKWLDTFKDLAPLTIANPNLNNLIKLTFPSLSLEDIGFKESSIAVKDYNLSQLSQYGSKRDFPSADVGSYLGPHLRFGTIGIRQLIQETKEEDAVFLSELIWREFFMQILYHFPHVVTENFRPKYNGIQWRNNKEDFNLWCQGKTGYPMVDAGMRQLNKTGYMHNRVRMVTAGFLCKHLLIDWRWGETYFAEKLLDYELSSNNGNWQWAAGTGCDAAPYFRIFNPHSQLKKFDKDFHYIRKWIPEFDSLEYPAPMVDHKMARERALEAYKSGIQND
ncbi:deoxyribodipyrimidine photo-lyase [Arenibacter aquaticus]|uniref:Deoxyribodipyrimidine photo-lyase n=1 Tax=Arenibacter aquaticus TaxID=2489054 RepID=A0A430K3N1_9FLAO|nr:deoxyribodipyrimidine photo-lyase [Arenibacter aquaticus]RTE53675.1 deoxyribodipyrimidine photo-lyase [Arenibacter aquaticus]